MSFTEQGRVEEDTQELETVDEFNRLACDMNWRKSGVSASRTYSGEKGHSFSFGVGERKAFGIKERFEMCKDSFQGFNDLGEACSVDDDVIGVLEKVHALQ